MPSPSDAPSSDDVREVLLELAHELGAAEEMALTGEGNVSGKLDADRFLVKASGTRLADLTGDELVEVETAPLRALFERAPDPDDPEMEDLLLEARRDPDALKPSVETLFHARLLELPGVRYVGHTHPIAANGLLASPRAEAFARRRIFPDQIVYCGAESVLVPYVDPGAPLARTIAERVDRFRTRTGGIPRTVFLRNHGVVAVGASAGEVRAAVRMAEKSARIFLGALRAGGPDFLPDAEVRRIERRQDEEYRRSMIGRT